MAHKVSIVVWHVESALKSNFKFKTETTLYVQTHSLVTCNEICIDAHTITCAAMSYIMLTIL